jgi:hypothetical protein
MPTTLALSLVWRNRSPATIFSMGGDVLVPSDIKMSVVFVVWRTRLGIVNRIPRSRRRDNSLTTRKDERLKLQERQRKHLLSMCLLSTNTVQEQAGYYKEA